MPKFKINDTVQTNLFYTNGFGGEIYPPSGLKLLKNLTIAEIIKTHKTLEEAQEISNNKNTSNYIYVCKSKTKEYILNECFLEKMI